MENLSNKSTKWVLDPAHSELTFKVKHLMISSVKGEFKNFTARGLNWNAALETGGVLVSDDVKISGEVQFVKQN